MPALPAAGRLARGGGSRPSAPRSPARSTGAGRSPATGTRAPRWSCSGWRPPPTAATAPGGSSPATARATGCSPRCYRAGMANQPTSRSRDDGLRLTGCWVCAAVRCAPPANKPTPAERDTCLPYAVRELALLRARGSSSAWGASPGTRRCGSCGQSGARCPGRGPRFGHGAEAQVGELTLLGCYHPSQQNTFTGKLTEPMIDAVMARARELSWVSSSSLPGWRSPIRPSAGGRSASRSAPAIASCSAASS